MSPTGWSTRRWRRSAEPIGPGRPIGGPQPHGLFSRSDDAGPPADLASHEMTLGGDSVSDTPRTDGDDPIVEPVSDAAVEDSDFWDDEDGWDQGNGAAVGAGASPRLWFIGVAVVAVLVIGFLIFRGGGSDDPKANTNAGATTPDGGTTGAKQCANWPGIGGFGKPEISSKPGIHVWSDLKGWHISRVPGEGVPAVNAEVTNNDQDQPPSPKGDPSGGATEVVEGQTLKISLPASAEPSQADFDIGPYTTRAGHRAQGRGRCAAAGDHLHGGRRRPALDQPGGRPAGHEALRHLIQS